MKNVISFFLFHFKNHKIHSFSFFLINFYYSFFLNDIYSGFRLIEAKRRRAQINKKRMVCEEESAMQ